MNTERAIGFVAVALAAGMFVVWLTVPRTEDKPVYRSKPLGATTTGRSVLAMLNQVQPVDHTLSVLSDHRVWDCSYWDDTGSRDRSLSKASVIVQWCLPQTQQPLPQGDLP
jgi:hypothetical protein